MSGPEMVVAKAWKRGTGQSVNIDGGSVIELYLAAPEGVHGSVVIDLGMVEH